MSKAIEFSDIRNQLIKALESKDLKNDAGIHEDISLIDGFVTEPLRLELSKSLSLGSDSAVPMVMLIGKKTGRVYLFAVKALLKDLGI